MNLTDLFAEGRQFFDDDPKIELAKNGLEEADFTLNQPWDMYPVAQNLLKIWEICERFVTGFVSFFYPDDHAVAMDHRLEDWMKESADPRFGNIRGLPVMNNAAALTRGSDQSGPSRYGPRHRASEPQRQSRTHICGELPAVPARRAHSKLPS